MGYNTYYKRDNARPSVSVTKKENTNCDAIASEYRPVKTFRNSFEIYNDTNKNAKKEIVSCIERGADLKASKREIEKINDSYNRIRPREKREDEEYIKIKDSNIKCGNDEKPKSVKRRD